MKISVQNLQKKVPIQPGKIKRLILKILKGEKVKGSGWINVCFVDNARIRKVNAKFHKTDSSTDVLAFNLGQSRQIMAEIIVSAQKAVQQAAVYNNCVERELSLYACHGLLHILGYDDRTLAQAGLMRKKEKKYVY